MGGKTRLQMRTDLKTDLRTTTEITDAELNRAIERAVADLSRMLPREKTYEESLQFAVPAEEVAMPADTSTDAVVKDEVLNLCGAGSNTSIAGQPDVPRPLVITITDANNTLIGLTIDVYGSDENGEAIHETFFFTRGASGKTITGKKYFKKVYMVYTTQLEGAGPGDLLDVGYGAYTDVWVGLANKPIKWGSEKDVTDVDANALTRNTDFYIDYINGRIKAISSGGIVAGDTVTISYTKSQLEVDISSLADLIRVERAEYPVGTVPQSFVPFDVWGNILGVTGGPEADEQGFMAEDKHIRLYYAAEHQPPTDYSPGSVPEFLENTVLLAASAYALFIYALKQEIAAETQLSATATSLGNATGTHSALAIALTGLKKYLDNNSDKDAAGLLKAIPAAASLRTAIAEALNQTNAYLDLVASDITNANAVRKKYIDTVNYVAGGAEPDIKTYLASGDAILNTVAVGGEGIDVPEAYRRYAETVKSALVGAYETDRTMYLQNATLRTNAALAYTQEAAQRIANLRSHIEQSAGYAAVSSLFARQAEAILAQISAYLRQSSTYIEAAGGYMIMADRFRTEGIERRNEAWSIWRDRKQYIGDFTMSSVRQMP